MSTREQTLSNLLDAVGNLLDAFQAEKERNRALSGQLKDAQRTLLAAQQQDSPSNNLSTPTPPSQALSAAELDALVEEIDSCIALLKL